MHLLTWQERGIIGQNEGHYEASSATYYHVPTFS